MLIMWEHFGIKLFRCLRWKNVLIGVVVWVSLWFMNAVIVSSMFFASKYFPSEAACSFIQAIQALKHPLGSFCESAVLNSTVFV